MKNIKIWYLYNSGFAVKINEKLLIFDYYNDIPYDLDENLNSGVIRPDDLKDLDVYVFVTHKHHDHYNKVIYSWEQLNIAHSITYLLSNDIKDALCNNVHFFESHQDCLIDDLRILTLKSNDEGISFYVQVNDVNLFHSGDLNWWCWEDESDEWKEGIEQTYKSEIGRLKNLPLDIAFIPVDPRLKFNYYLSLKYFIDKIMPEHCTVIPMHFGDQYSIFNQLSTDGYLENKNILSISKRGQMFEIFC
ncbi:MAG: hydrolase [Firmicutes bacterium HGW-Firmicutes-7]|nr:MAG: hydrolase [Firmicutes bacterium HGW-Firmicutes-7]